MAITPLTPEQRERRLAAAQRYYAANREAVKAAHAAYYAKNAAKVIARQKVYQRERYASDPAWRAKCVERQRALRSRKRAEAAAPALLAVAA